MALLCSSYSPGVYDGAKAEFRDIYLLTTAAEDEEFTPKRAESGLQGWIDCYEKCALKAHLFCGGVNEPKEISGNTKLQEAYDLGKNI